MFNIFNFLQSLFSETTNEVFLHFREKFPANQDSNFFFNPLFSSLLAQLTQETLFSSIGKMQLELHHLLPLIALVNFIFYNILIVKDNLQSMDVFNFFDNIFLNKLYNLVCVLKLFHSLLEVEVSNKDLSFF